MRTLGLLFRIFGWFNVAIGICALGVGGLLWLYFSKKEKQFLETAGSIVRLEERQRGKDNAIVGLEERSGAGETIFHPVFEFQDASGTNHQVYSKYGSSPAAYDVGDKVRVRYHPREPKEAKIEGFQKPWESAAAVAIFSAFDLLFGFCMIAIGRFFERLAPPRPKSPPPLPD